MTLRTLASPHAFKLISLSIGIPVRVAALILAGQGYHSITSDVNCYTIGSVLFLLAIVSILISIPLPSTIVDQPQNGNVSSGLEFRVHLIAYDSLSYYLNVFVWIVSQTLLNKPGPCLTGSIQALVILRAFCAYFFAETLIKLFILYICNKFNH